MSKGASHVLRCSIEMKGNYKCVQARPSRSGLCRLRKETRKTAVSHLGSLLLTPERKKFHAVGQAVMKSKSGKTLNRPGCQ